MFHEILLNTWTYNTAKAKIPELDKYTTPKDFKKWRFIQLAESVHGKLYDYSKTNPTNKTSKVTIICPVHGEFEQSPKDHVTRAHGCKKCAVDGTRITREEFVQRSNSVHDSKYDYSKIPDIMPSAHSKVTIICPTHGEFEQVVNSHIRGHGCIKCANRELMGVESFIEKAKELHGDLFDYSEITQYLGNKEYVPIRCNKCKSVSLVLPNNHLRGHGCKNCSIPESKAELEIKEFIESLGFETEKLTLPSRKHIDIYVPELQVGVEFNGMYWHSTAYKDKSYHLDKTIEAENNDITLVHVWEDDWKFKKEVVKDILKSKLKVTERVYARNTEVHEVSSNEARDFCEANHIQGYANSAKSNVGLYYDNKLVMLISLGTPRFNTVCDTEILRISTKSGITVVGGASKLLATIPKGTKVLSYARRDYSSGDLYKVLGFTELPPSKPDYWYVNRRGDKLSRYQAMKHKLSSILDNFKEELTEEQNMTNHGYHRIYGCGNRIFIKEIQ